MPDRFYDVGEGGGGATSGPGMASMQQSKTRQDGQRGERSTVVTMHIHGVKDANSFRYSQGQIEQNMVRFLEQGQRRNS